ncbi:HotDog domain-containing protein [Syncephalis fuscata]|nr:HotDog domain-containing protein [Syncephalis fuscata]
MFPLSLDSNLGASWFAGTSTIGLLGTMAVLAMGAIMFRQTSHASSKLATTKTASHFISKSSPADYHANARKRTDALSSVRYLRNQCNKAKGQEQPNYQEFYPRKIQLASMSSEQGANHLAISTLYGPNLLTDWPVFCVRMAGTPSEVDPGIVSTAINGAPYYNTHIVYFHLGAALCGHKNIIHGGLLATLVDEIFGMHVWTEGGAALTANLSVDYRRPVMANQVIRARTWAIKKDGRKIWVRALLEAVEAAEPNSAIAIAKTSHEPATEENAKNGQVLVEANALFIFPRDGIPKVV